MNDLIKRMLGRDVFIPQTTERYETYVKANIFAELYVQRRKPRAFTFGPVLQALKVTGEESKVEGIENITGLGENITVFLKDSIDMKVMKKAIEGSNRFYLAGQNIFGDKFCQVRVSGEILTLGLSTVALDRIYHGNNSLEIRKGRINIWYGTQALGKYLKQRYGSLELK